MPDSESLSCPGRELADLLVHGGHLTSPEWVTAFTEVPRHVFMPRVYVPRPEGGFRVVDVDGTAPLAYQDEAWVTQLDGGHPAPDGNGVVHGAPTSSTSAPSLMAAMLEALDVADGMRVLEVGTGTGYNAALLCHRLGGDRVTTVEFDPELAEQARQRLGQLGCRPTVHVGDGAVGYPPNAPYDRVIVTCALPHVPWSLVEQARPGGVLAVPLWRGHLPCGLMLRLTVDGDDRAQGSLLDQYGGFMPTRGVPPSQATQLLARRDTDAGDERDTDLTGHPVYEGEPWAWFAALTVPDAEPVMTVHTDGATRHWLFTLDSWGYLTSDRRVVQGGRRRLWDEIEAARDEWQQLGCPDRNRFQVAVDREGARLLFGDREWLVV